MPVPVLENSDFGTSSASFTVTLSAFTISAGSDRVLTVTAKREANTSTGVPNSVTINGINLTKINEVRQPDSPTGFINGASLWALLDTDFPANGDHDIVATFDTDPADTSNTVGAQLWSGLTQTLPSGAQENTDGQASATTLTLDVTTTSESNHLILGTASSGQTGAFDLPTGFTAELYDVTIGTSRGAAAYDFVTDVSTLIDFDYVNSASQNRLAGASVSWAEPTPAGGRGIMNPLFGPNPLRGPLG